MVSVVSPVFREERNLGPFVERVVEVLSGLKPPVDYELVLVNDGSDDGTGLVAAGYCDENPRVKLVELSRNFGHQIALTAGLDAAGGDAIVTLDSDLQDPPEVIRSLVDEWRAGWDIVYAQRSKRREEPRILQAFAKLYYRLMRFLVGSAFPVDVADFRLIDSRVLAELKKLREEDRYLRGLVPWLGFRERTVSYVRDPRHAGDSNYRFFRRVGLALAGVTGFSDRPLRLASIAGAIFTALALAFALYIVTARLIGIGSASQGYASLFAAVLFFGGVQLLALGLTGEYIARIFRETKRRPLYVVYRTLNINGNASAPGFDADSVDRG